MPRPTRRDNSREIAKTPAQFNTEAEVENLRFAFYASKKLADDTGLEAPFETRADAAKIIAKSIAEAYGELITVATYDPEKPEQVEPIYTVSPWRPK